MKYILICLLLIGCSSKPKRLKCVEEAIALGASGHIYMICLKTEEIK